MAVNFFVVFMGVIWYLLAAANVTQKFFDWQDGKKLKAGKRFLMEFRRKNSLELVDDEDIRNYRLGTDGVVDEAFMNMKMKSARGEDISEDAKNAEVKMTEIKMGEMEGKIEDIGKGSPSPASTNLIRSYTEGIRHEQKKLMDYEKKFYKKFVSKEG